MRLGQQIFLGVLIGLAVCVWVTFTQPRLKAEEEAKVTPLPVAVQDPTPTPVKPVVAGQSSIKILIYNVKITVTDPITDLVYGEIKDGNNTWAGFTTKSLLAKYPACKAGALGTLVRIKASPTPTPSPTRSPSPSPSVIPTFTPIAIKSPTNQPFSKTIDGYTYTYRQAYYGCADDQAGRDAVAAARAAVKNSALPTLSN